MEEILEKLDAEYRQVVGEYQVEYSYGYIPVSFHGCQIIPEFAATWADLAKVVAESDKDVITFLEVGAYKGLWALMFRHICEHYGKTPHYATVTWMEQDGNNHPLPKVKAVYDELGYRFDLVDGNSIDQSTKDRLIEAAGLEKFDIVFIDADHRYEFVKADIDLYADMASSVLFFHDIKPREKNENCGVYQAIQDSGIVLDVEHTTNDHIMGLGLKFIK